MRYLKFLWLLPVSLLFMVIYGCFYVFGQIESVVFVKKELIFVWELKESGFIFRKLFRDREFLGFSSGCHILMKDVDSLREAKLYLHEREHCRQQFNFGVFFLLFYVIEYLKIYFTEEDKHPYFDNRFEVEARKVAGQEVKIDWKKINKDRWIWW